MKKLLMGTELFCASMLSADMQIFIENIKDPIFLIEVGDSNTQYAPAPLRTLQSSGRDNFVASNSRAQGIINSKIVYSAINNKNAPACEFNIQVVQDMQSKLYKVQKVSATAVRTDYKMPIQCFYDMDTFNPFNGLGLITYRIIATSPTN